MDGIKFSKKRTMNKNSIDKVTSILAKINYIIDFPALLIEEIIRRIKPGWEWTPFSLIPYYLLMVLFPSYILVSHDNIGLIVFCFSLMTIIELEAFWKCVLLALGRRAIMHPSQIGLTSIKRPTGGRILLTKTSFFVAVAAFGFSIYYFAFLFLIAFKIDRYSFYGIKLTTGIENLWDFFYFSFITITTIGYGDIYPVSILARCFVILENIVGIFFIVFFFTIIVAYHFEYLQKRNK